MSDPITERLDESDLAGTIPADGGWLAPGYPRLYERRTWAMRLFRIPARERIVHHVPPLRITLLREKTP